jgi:hypothetical protein
LTCNICRPTFIPFFLFFAFFVALTSRCGVSSNDSQTIKTGLGTVYLINTVLAVLAVFKAGERGQPAALWVAKTFTVGGLAFDQLTQLPTLEETARAKAVKGKRALKNQKK